MTTKLFQTASGIATEWSLTAFAIAAVFSLVALHYKSKRRKTPILIWVAIGCSVLLCLLTVTSAKWLPSPPDGVYHVRITVLNPDRTPVEDAQVWSTFGGEAKKVAGGWQFDVPAGTIPDDGKMTVHAAVTSAFLAGQTEVLLTAERNVVGTIKLERDVKAAIGGIVQDDSGKAIVGARVHVLGFSSEAIQTDTSGGFQLAAHAAKDQPVQLHAEKEGYDAITQWHRAGTDPAVLVLKKQSTNNISR